MKKTVFSVPKMDCPSEERLIRMALDETEGIEALSFDLGSRELAVVHSVIDAALILGKLSPLNFGAKLKSTTDFVAGSEVTGIVPNTKNDEGERGVLKVVFVINAVMFFVGLVGGLIGQSTGLIADSLDMFADATVFGLSLYAVGKALSMKKRAARLSGYLQMALSLFAIFEVVRRFVQGSEPEAPYMVILAGVALLANAISMYLLSSHRQGEVHMRASWIFLSNDVIANAGVILAGFAVGIFDSHVPDLIIGAIISGVVFSGSIRILRASR